MGTEGSIPSVPDSKTGRTSQMSLDGAGGQDIVGRMIGVEVESIKTYLLVKGAYQ